MTSLESGLILIITKLFSAHHVTHNDMKGKNAFVIETKMEAMEITRSI
jgi:hypothetical protein